MPDIPREEIVPTDTGRDRAKPAKPGAWLPWPIAEAVCRLSLKPSEWRVFLAVLVTQQRYGGTEARLDSKQLAAITALSESTVRRAVKGLIASGHLSRLSRYRRLRANPDAGAVAILAAPEVQVTPNRAANIVAAPSGHHGGRSPTCFYVLSIDKGMEESTGFTAAQARVVRDVLSEASQLLGADARGLALPDEAALRLDLPAGTTYGDALVSPAVRSCARHRRDLVRAILGLRHDERVQGRTLQTAANP